MKKTKEKKTSTKPFDLNSLKTKDIPYKKFHKIPEIEEFYRFLKKYDLRQEAYDILIKFFPEKPERKLKETKKKQVKDNKKAKLAKEKKPKSSKKAKPAKKKQTKSSKKAKPAKKKQTKSSKKAKPAKKKQTKSSKKAKPAKKKQTKKR